MPAPGCAIWREISSPDRASIWTDINIYNELGIPAIKIGRCGRRISARNEEIEVDVMVKAAQSVVVVASR